MTTMSTYCTLWCYARGHASHSEYTNTHNGSRLDIRRQLGLMRDTNVPSLGLRVVVL